MSADSLSAVLLISSIVSLAMILVLLVSRQGLGEAARGTGMWILGDLLQALARMALIGSLTPWFIEAWRSHIGPWQDHQLPSSLHLVGFFCRVVALRLMVGVRIPSRLGSIAIGMGLFVGWALLIGLVPPPGMRMVLVLSMVAVCSAAVFQAAWPLARRSWGARLLLLTSGMGVIFMSVRLTRALLEGPGSLDALEQITIEKDFVGELVNTLIGTMAFVLIQQERLRERIVELSVTDALTGSFNRHGLLPLLRRELQASRRSGQPLSVVLFDLDHFKRINDEYGHGVGDAVLRAVATRMQAATRPRDALCRWGGEEFLLVLPDLHGEMATQVANRVVSALRNEPLVLNGGKLTLTITASAGVAMVGAGSGPLDDPDLDAAIDPLIAEADRKLYQAKKHRDCVESDWAARTPGWPPAAAAAA